MKAAIYSRVMIDEQHDDVQLFFDELDKQKIIPVVFLPFFNEIHGKINFPSTTETFSASADLNEDVEFIISLGGDGTLLDTITLVRDKKYRLWGSISADSGFSLVLAEMKWQRQ